MSKRIYTIDDLENGQTWSMPYGRTISTLYQPTVIHYLEKDRDQIHYYFPQDPNGSTGIRVMTISSFLKIMNSKKDVSLLKNTDNHEN